jgi:ketosteroid isomerase-like protein
MSTRDTDNRAAIEALVRRVLDARLAGRIDDITACLTPDVALRFPGSAGSGDIERSSHSRDAVRAHLAQLIDVWRWTGWEIESILVDGPRAAVHVRQSLVHAPSGTAMTCEVLDLVTVRDGLVSEFVEFVDTAAVGALEGTQGH